MRPINIIVIFCLLFCLFGCEAVYFDQPQPTDKKDLKNFPKKFRCEISTEEVKVNVRKSELEFEGDESLVMSLSDSFRLRKSGNNYFFNVLYENGWWKVFHIEGDSKQGLSLFVINSDDMHLLTAEVKLQEISPESVDGYEDMSFVEEELWRGGFSSKQLNDFILSGGFSDTVVVISDTIIKR